MLKHILKAPADHTMSNIAGTVFVGDENGEVSTSSEEHVKVLEAHGFTFLRHEEIKVGPSAVDVAIAAIQSAPPVAQSAAPVEKAAKPEKAAFTGAETREDVEAMPFMRKKAWAVFKGAEFNGTPDGETLNRIIDALFSMKPVESF